jgi:hypothetical protein
MTTERASDEYEQGRMEYTHLGSSGLKISRIALGAMSVGDGGSGREGRRTWAVVEASAHAGTCGTRNCPRSG